MRVGVNPVRREFAFAISGFLRNHSNNLSSTGSATDLPLF